MVADATGRITRPRQIYTGELRRKFIPVYERQLSGRISGEGGRFAWTERASVERHEVPVAVVSAQRRRPHPLCTQAHHKPTAPPMKLSVLVVSLPTNFHPPCLPAVPADFKESSGFRSNLLSRLVDTSARTALR